MVDLNNDRWVEVTGEGVVSVAPDFARVTLGVTTAGKYAGEAMAANAKLAERHHRFHQIGGRRAGGHPDVGDLDLADVLAALARSSRRAGDHRL